ncbi:MAG: DUF3386 family protein [Planctomycetota bacterium]|nr:MAG: DUF3386 family protein [Planctomycetota bacterium]
MVVVLGLFAASQPAFGHFLFTRICPPAEGGRVAEVYFSEYATAGDPRYIDKVATATFQIQTKPGEFKTLPMRRLADRLRGHVPAEGPLLVAGKLDYGVLERTPPFLLRHYSKAVAGTPEEVNRFSPTGSPIELLAKFEPTRVVLTALLDGRPMPNVRIDTVDADLVGEELTTDADGRAIFEPSEPGVYCVYVGHTLDESGEYRGTAYDEIRRFATLSFAWPLAPSEPDHEAVALFEEALAARATWQNFTGFTADLEGDLDGRPCYGTVKVSADGSVEVDLDEDQAMAEWIDDQLESITMHRAASQTPSDDGPKPSLRFADQQTDHPLGRLLAFQGGHFASSYRVKDKQLTTVNRVIDGQNVTITVLDNLRNEEGKFLPRLYTVQYWDESTGEPVRTETVQDRWTRVGKWDLPAEHTVTTASADGYTVRTFKLADHTLIE